jgi:hypothetical protein
MYFFTQLAVFILTTTAVIATTYLRRDNATYNATYNGISNGTCPTEDQVIVEVQPLVVGTFVAANAAFVINNATFSVTNGPTSFSKLT